MKLQTLLRRQAGVIARGQAMDAGLSRYAVDRRLAGGRWRALHPAVYLVDGHRLTDEVELRAAVLWAGPDAVLGGTWAAWWHGLLDAAPDGPIGVTVPPSSGRRGRSGIRVRRRELPALDVEEVRDVPLTRLPLTALEAAVALGDAGPVFLDRALQRGVSFAAVGRAHSRQLGSAGSRAAGDLLVAAGDRAASAAERRLIRLLRAAGVTGWHLGFAVGRQRIDLAFPASRVAVEVDGWAWHVDVERFRADRQRQNALVTAGWTVLRFSWHDLNGRPGEVLVDIRSALRAAA